MHEVCHNLQIEPELLPIDNQNREIKGKQAEKAWLDVSRAELWESYEKTFLDSVTPKLSYVCK